MSTRAESALTFSWERGRRGDGVEMEQARHRADAATGTTSRRRRGDCREAIRHRADTTLNTHRSTTTPKPAANYKDELEEALDNVRLSGQSERKSEERPASTELRLGFDARAFLDMEYYYQDMNGAQKGPVDFEGLKAVWTRSEIDELSYIYTNRKDEWVDLASLPSLVRRSISVRDYVASSFEFDPIFLRFGQLEVGFATKVVKCWRLFFRDCEKILQNS